MLEENFAETLESIQLPKDTPPLVEGLLEKEAFSCAYGKANTGKTFWAMDLAYHIARGETYRDMQVTKGNVLYLCLEGGQGSRRRAFALKARSGTSEDSMFFRFKAFNLTKAKDLKDLNSFANDHAIQFMVIDTLARSAPGLNENNGDDMSMIVDSVDQIRFETGSHVMLIHHTGKDSSKGLRGHSNLTGAIDSGILIESNDKVSSVRVKKQRDLEIRPPFSYSLEVETLGQDRSGKDITTCLVNHLGEPLRAGRPSKYSHDDLLEILPKKGGGIRVGYWSESVRAKTGMSDTTFKKLKSELLTLEKVQETKEGQWIQSARKSRVGKVGKGSESN